MSTLHARIVDAMRKEGREVREVGARGKRRWDDLVITGNTIEHFSVQPRPRCTYCTETAAHMSPNTRGGVSVPACDACWESMCAMGQYAQAVHGHEEPRDGDPAAAVILCATCAREYLEAPGRPGVVCLVNGDHVLPDELPAVQYKWPHDPIVVRLVDSDYVLPDDPTWAGTRRRP